MKKPPEEQIASVFGVSAAKRSTKDKEKMDTNFDPSSRALTPVEELTSNKRAAQMLALYFTLYYNEEAQRRSMDTRSKGSQKSLSLVGKYSQGTFLSLRIFPVLISSLLTM